MPARRIVCSDVGQANRPSDEARLVPMPTIAVIGDFDQGFEPHNAIAPSLKHVRTPRAQQPAKAEWISTIDCEGLADHELSVFDGFWIAPGSPYKSMLGALRVISYARTANVPLLGTCGGFQHVVLEYARNVMGFKDAGHAEYDPYASRLFISELSCSLAGQTMTVHILANTVAARAYGTDTASERYYCNFGLNLKYLDELQSSGIVVSGFDSEGEPRIIELPDARFFVATLFVPQTLSDKACPHPVIAAFAAATYLD